jgi:hypothetical protein
MIAPSVGLESALAHAARGRDVFPFSLTRMVDGNGKVKHQKTPRVPWQDKATTDPDAIRMMWRGGSVALPGWRLPVGLVVVDVDEPQRFADAYLELPTTATQSTPSGGAHYVYQTDGREVRQTVKEIPGADTRTGGRGWVGLYSADAFTDAPIAAASPWLYDLSRDRVAITTDDVISSRAEILSLAGTFRVWGLIPEEIEALLLRRQELGKLVDADEVWPWSAEDLHRIAFDIGTKPRKARPAITIRRSWRSDHRRAGDRLARWSAR